MTITIKIPTSLRNFTGGKEEVAVEAKTVREALDALETSSPGIKERIVDEKGVRRFINLFLNDEDIRFLQNLDTPVSDKDALVVLPAIAGGR